MKKYCINCKKEVTRGSKLGRCNSCSNKEKIRLGIINNKGRNNGNFIDGRTLKQNHCIDCNEELSDYRNKRCHKCQKKYYVGKQHPNYIDGSRCEKHPCKDCGKEISKRSLRCKKCAKQGELHPSFIDGRSNEPYPLRFNDTLKGYIRQRDSFICQNCNMTEEEHLKLFNYSLIIHHIDYNKNDCKENNLITVCHNCNTKANANRDYWYSYYKYIIEE